MEFTKSIEQILDSTENTTVVKTKKSHVPGLISAAVGVCFAILSSQINAASGSMIPTLFLTVGMLLVAVGFAMVFWSKSRYKTVKDGKALAFSEMTFDSTDRDKLLRILAERDIKEIVNLKSTDSGSLKLRIASTCDGDLCYVQAMAYVPHQYETISDVIRLTAQEGKTIQELNKRK